MIVLKFGGTSVGDADAIRRASAIVASRRTRDPVVVVSALGGATNALLAIADHAARGHLIAALRSVEELRSRHLRVAEALLGSGAEGRETASDLSALFDELATLAGALATLGDLTPRSQDAIAAYGERLSSRLCEAALRAAGLPVQHVDARDVMITDSHFTKAEPDPDAIAAAAARVLAPIVRDGTIPVLGGFIGSSKQGGVTTTLGRGGGDYSASLFGAALRAEAIEIWTDVDGMLTADPRVVKNATPIECIGFDEAAELASFGAKVLHPSTIAPAVRVGIPVFVLNSRNPASPGTMITFRAPRRAVTAIAGKTPVALVKVRSPSMLLTEGFLRSLFEVFERHRTSVDVVATSEVSVSLTVDDPLHLDEVVVELRSLGDVAVERNRGIVAVVGAGLSDGGLSMSRALQALGNTRIYMLSLSATGINLTIVVEDEEVNPAMARLHAAFFDGAGR